MPRDLPALVLVVAVVVACLMIQREGHDWGDDFALYVRQAQGLVDGNPGQVIADNRYALDNSSWDTFSPEAYPWGWPLLMAPLVAIFGLDFTSIKWLGTFFFAVFLVAFYRVVQRRGGTASALAVTALVGFSVPSVGSTDTVLSELPYLAFVGLSLWWLDHCRESGALSGSAPRSWPPLLGLGVLLAGAVSVRREGIALIAAVVVAQVIEIRRHRPHRRHGSSDRQAGQSDSRSVVAALVPHAAVVVVVGVLRVALPGSLAKRYPGTGLGQLPTNLQWYMGPLAEQLGLRDAGTDRAMLLGSHLLALATLAAFLVLAGIGLLARLATVHVRCDAAIATFLGATCLLIGVLPFHEGRYLFSVTPFVAYFAVQAIPSVIAAGARWARGAGGARAEPSDPPRQVARAVGAALIALLAVAAMTDTRLRVAQTFAADHATVSGPEASDSKEMFAEVKSRVSKADVVAFHRARAMTLYSGRRSVQLLSLEELLAKSDWYVRVKDPADYSQVPLSLPQATACGITLAWQNQTFELWRVPPDSVPTCPTEAQQ